MNITTTLPVLRKSTIDGTAFVDVHGHEVRHLPITELYIVTRLDVTGRPMLHDGYVGAFDTLAEAVAAITPTVCACGAPDTDWSQPCHVAEDGLHEAVAVTA